MEPSPGSMPAVRFGRIAANFVDAGWSRLMALIVLGAGATRGASFVGGDDGPLCLPPLDGDFFTQLQRIDNDKHRETVDRLLAAAVEFFGHNFNLTLETMFTTIEHQIRIVEKTTGERWGESLDDLREKRANLLQAIAAVLEESLTYSPQGGTGHTHRDCHFHRKLVGQLLPSDAIISFNYDCLVDHTLQTYGEGRWNARYGYCLPLRPGAGSRLAGEQAWNPSHPPSRHETIRLLKLHGSLHFKREDAGHFSLKERPYTKQTTGNLRFEIIPRNGTNASTRGSSGGSGRKRPRRFTGQPRSSSSATRFRRRTCIHRHCFGSRWAKRSLTMSSWSIRTEPPVTGQWM